MSVRVRGVCCAYVRMRVHEHCVQIITDSSYHGVLRRSGAHVGRQGREASKQDTMMTIFIIMKGGVYAPEKHIGRF